MGIQRLNLAADAHMNVVGLELGLLVMVPVLRLLKLLRRFEPLGGVQPVGTPVFDSP